MGAVYEALNLTINKRVALKFLFRDEALDADTAARFQREAEAASAVDSAHIVQIFDAGMSEGGRPYLVMELLDGEDLRQLLKRDGKLSLSVALSIISQLLRALDRAHRAGVIHRDLKPDNIFICRRDDNPLFVKVVDFGISKLARPAGETLTRQGTVLGTAHYMSPEQAQAYTDIDGRADLYSVGAMLYEALAGRPPHQAQTYEAVLIRACTTQAADIREHAPEVPEAVAKVIARSIARDRSERFQTPKEFAEALEQAAPEAWAELPSSFSTPRAGRLSQSVFADTEQDQTPDVIGDSIHATRVELKAGVQPETSRRRLKLAGLVAAGVLLCAAAAIGIANRPGPSAPTRQAKSALPHTKTGAPEPSLARDESSSPPPAPRESAPASASPGMLPTAGPRAVSSRRPIHAVGRSEETTTKPTAPPPHASGVAGQLQLKTEGP
jgi:serine/threonine-protein kinase